MSGALDIEGIMDWAMTTGLSVALLILFVLLVRKPVARHLGAKTAYALWSLPLIRLFMPSIILPAKPAVLASPAPPFVPRGEWAVEMSTVSVEPAYMDMSIFVWIWMAGGALILIWQIRRHLTFRQEMHAQSRLVTEPILTKASGLMAELSLTRLPEIRISTESQGPIMGPMVTGLFRPVIILPSNFETDYSDAQQKYALAHELAHISRGDIWATSAAILFKALNWPNPLMRWAHQAFRADQEAACDATVLSILGPSPQVKSAYAETLIHAAKLVRSARLAGFSERPIPVGLTIHNPLKERLMIINTSPANRLSLRLAVSTLALAAILATASYDRAEAQQSPTPPAPPTTMSSDHSVDKKVMKWVTNDNGTSVSKHIEITTENGVTTAYEIDELGNKTLIDADEIVMPHSDHMAGGKMRMKIKKMGESGDTEHVFKNFATGDPESIQIFMKKLGENGDVDFDFKEFAKGDHKDMQIFMKKLGDGEDFDIEAFKDMQGKNVFVFEGEKEMDMIKNGHSKMIIKSLKGNHFPGSAQPEMMVSMAGSMLDDIDTGTLDRKARKKIEAARKALAEAQEILEDE